MHLVGHTEYSKTCELCSSVGPFAHDREGATAHTFRQIIMKHGMVFANTFHKCGHSFFGPGYSSLIDFVLLPRTLLAEVTKCHTLLGMASRLSSIHTRELRDHAPVLLQWRHLFAVDANQFVRWDRNKLMRAIQGDFVIRDAFNHEFNRCFMQAQDEEQVQYTPDTVWNRLAKVVKTVAEKHFVQQASPASKMLTTWKSRFFAG